MTVNSGSQNIEDWPEESREAARLLSASMVNRTR